jgi:hypothetical protein
MLTGKNVIAEILSCLAIAQTICVVRATESDYCLSHLYKPIIKEILNSFNTGSVSQNLMDELKSSITDSEFSIPLTPDEEQIIQPYLISIRVSIRDSLNRLNDI